MERAFLNFFLLFWMLFFFNVTVLLFFSVLYLTSTIQKNLVVLSLGLFCLCCCHNNCRIFFHQIAVVVVVLFTNRKTTFFFFKKISLSSFFFLDLRWTTCILYKVILFQVQLKNSVLHCSENKTNVFRVWKKKKIGKKGHN